MNPLVGQLLTLVVVMLVLDGVYLSSISAQGRAVYAGVQGRPIQARWFAAAMVYVLMIAGLWYFAVSPASDWQDAAFRGALLGAVVYGVYDFTNHALLVKYPLSFALQDWAWGILLFGVSAAVAKAVAS
jgi:uncharacterized membrane protein